MNDVIDIDGYLYHGSIGVRCTAAINCGYDRPCSPIMKRGCADTVRNEKSETGRALVKVWKIIGNAS